MYDKVLDEGINTLSNILLKNSYFRNSHFILVDNYASFNKITKEKWYQQCSMNNGIWIGEGLDMQQIIHIHTLNKCDITGNLNGVIFPVVDGIK